jgi:hypothetical protein
VRRVAITEGPTDALSLAVLEGHRRGTLYVATGGGMGPGTLGALQTILARFATVQDAPRAPPTRTRPETATRNAMPNWLPMPAYTSSDGGRRKASISTTF